MDRLGRQRRKGGFAPESISIKHTAYERRYDASDYYMRWAAATAIAAAVVVAAIH